MSGSKVYFVGSRDEVAHHAAPLVAPLGCQVIGSSDIVTLARPGDVAIFYSEHFDRFRDAVRQLKLNQVATLYMIDGILEWRNAWENGPEQIACPFTMRPVLSHKVACIGPSQQRTLNMWDNGPKTEVVGIPRLERLPLAPDPELLPSEDVFRVLVTTAKTPAFSVQQQQRVEQSLTDLWDYFSVNPMIGSRRVEIVWRLTKKLASTLGVENSLRDLSGDDLAFQLAHVNAVISTASTAMVEAMLYDLPVALLDYHNVPAYVHTAWAIRTKCQINSVVTELADPSQQKMIYQRGQLHDAVFLQSEGTDRLVNLIRGMQEIAAEQIAAGQKLCFPAELLPATESIDAHSVDYTLTNAFADVPEFSIVDREELQAQLAGSRLKIDQLKTQLQVRETELDRAHQVFEKVRKHPVVGPVVKLRRFFRRMLGLNPKSAPSKSAPAATSPEKLAPREAQ